MSSLGWVMGGISRHCRLDWFPHLGAVPRKVSKEADPSALWEGDGELMSSREALVVASDSKFSSCPGGKDWKANKLLNSIMYLGTLW